MSWLIQLRRDTAADWTTKNPVLAAGEPGVEIDTDKFKIGDGVTAWVNLDYAGGGTGTSYSDAQAVAALVNATAVAPTGAWDFAQGPTVNGAPISASAPPDASATVKGVVQLAGALGGTAAAPTALGMTGQADLTPLVQSIVAAFLAEGTNITLTNDGAGSLTIAAANPTLATLPAGVAGVIKQNTDGTYPQRPTIRTDLTYLVEKTVTGSADPARVVPPAVNGVYDGDVLIRAVA